MKLYRLKDQAIINMGQSPKSEFYNFNKIGMPFLQGKTSFGDKYHSIDMWTSSPIKIAKKGDILLSVRAPVGSLNIAIEDVCIGRGLAKLTSKYGNNEYLYYLLKANNDKLVNKSSGTIFESVNKNDIENLQISFHNEVEQEKIANILSSLDDKIELNNRINKNLEELAKTLYKQWFVDFEFPNEDGEPYKSSGGEMVESKLGLIPKDWNINYLCYISEIERGLSYKGKHLCESGVPMINLGSIKAKGGYNYDKIKFYNGDYKQKNVVSKGDIIIVNTDMTSTRDILGTPIMVPSIYHGDIIFSHHLYALRKLKISRSYLYYYLKSDTFKNIAENYANGTTVLAIAKNDVEQAPVLIPSDRILKLFSSIVDNVIDTVSNNEVQNISLTKTRDELLPKLMNGEIEVPIEE